MRPPSRWLAPGARTAMPPPPDRQEAAPGDQRAPPTPPPLPVRPKSGRRQTEETAAPHHPRRRRCTPGAGAPRLRQAPARPARCRPTADRRRPGRRKRRGLIRGLPGEDGGGNQGGGVPPPPPPPRRTDPSAADRTALDARGRPAASTARVYPGGARRRQRMAGRRPTGREGGGAAPPHPPPRSPPQLGSDRSGPPSPGAEGTPPPPPPPRRDRDAGGGGCSWACTPRAPAPPAACSRRGRGRRASPHQRAGATRTPEQYGGRAPHDPPVTTAHSGRAEGGLGLQGPPGERSTGGPSPPPTLGRHRDPDRTRTPEGSAPTTRGGPGWSTAGRHPEREQGGRGATPPPHPPHRPASRGGPGPHPPRQGGLVPPPPERGAGARPAPPLQAAGSHRDRG